MTTDLFWMISGRLLWVSLLARAFSPGFSWVFELTQADGLGWDDGAPLAL